MTNPTVGDLTARLRFYYSDDPLDFKKTGKGVVIMEDGVANIPLPAGPPGPPGRLAESDRLAVRRAVASVDRLEEASQGVMKAWTEAKDYAIDAESSASSASSSAVAADEARSGAVAARNRAIKAEEEAGKDAYTLAVENGFTGSVAEWLSSLKGETGEPLTWEDLTEEQKTELEGEKGDKGDPFTHADFTPEQLEDLRGPAGAVDNVLWEEVNNKPSTFPPEDHEHTIKQVSGLEGALDKKLDASGVEDAIAGKTDIGHKHVMDDIDDLPEVTAAIKNNAIVQRAANGQIGVPSRPIVVNQATSKGYVDDEVATRTTPDTVSAMISAAVDALVDGAPDALDTLFELAKALKNNDEAVAALITQLAGKAKVDHKHTMEDITDLPDVTDQPDGGAIVQREADGRIRVQDADGFTDYAAGGLQLLQLSFTLAEYVDDKIGTRATPGYVDEKLAGKSDTGHKHTRADITDLPEISADAVSSGVVQRHSDGHITVPNTPISAGDAGSKYYIDQQVAGKSGTGHKHVSDDITDASTTVMPGKVVKYSDSGRLQTDDPSGVWDATNKQYVDSRTPEIKFVSAGSAPNKAPAGQLIMEYE